MLDNWVRELREVKRYWKDPNCFSFCQFFFSLFTVICIRWQNLAVGLCTAVFYRCSEEQCCLLLAFWEECFVLCYLQMNHRKETAFGRLHTCSLLQWEQELFPWELFHASAGFLVPHCPAPSCHQENGELQPWGFCPQLGKAFAIFVKGEKELNMGSYRFLAPVIVLCEHSREFPVHVTPHIWSLKELFRMGKLTPEVKLPRYLV